MKQNFLYCIMCERHRTSDIETGLHIVTDGLVRARLNSDLCFGPFTFCPPPELEIDWELNLMEPSPNELARMNISGLELAAQFVQ